MMKYGAPKKCPVCGGSLQITQMRCGNCRTTVSGEFEQCRFCKLDEKHLDFLTVFLRNRGSIKDVEREMGISYPSVRNLLDSLLSELGLSGMQADKEDTAHGSDAKNSPAARKEILAQIASGQLSANEGARLLRKLN